MAKTLRVRNKTGWVTKPVQDLPVNRLTAEEVDDNFLELENQIEQRVRFVDYAPGIVIDSADLLVKDSSGLWMVSGSAVLPYTTDGLGMPEGTNFEFIGESKLIQTLADTNSTVSIGESTAGNLGKGIFAGVRLQTGLSTDVLVRSNTEGSTHVQFEPNGFVDEGTPTQTTLTFDPYQDDQSNYRSVKVSTSTVDSNGQNGSASIRVCSNGEHFGLYPTLDFGFDNQGVVSSPIKLVHFDTSDTDWRTRILGIWRQGLTVSIGDYVLSSSKLFRASTAGTTGETKPVHGTGIVSDGSVEWEFIRDYSLTVANIESCVILGDTSDMPKFGLPGAGLQSATDVALWHGKKIRMLNNTDQEIVQIGVDDATTNFTIKSSLGAEVIFDAVESTLKTSGISRVLGSSVVATSPTLDLTGTEIAVISHGVPTNITSITGKPYQKVYVEADSTNTTLVHSASIVLVGAADKNLAVNEVLTFVMDSTGTVARQVV